MKKNKIRDLIYVSRTNDQQCFYSYGIEFFEFINSIPNRPENLILLNHHFDYARRNQHTNFEYVTRLEIELLLDDDVYGYGNFCWVDFAKEEDLNRLSNGQIAELLFFSHMAKPMKSIPMNRFAYYAHDDGWFNKLYVTDLRDYESLLSNVIINKLGLLTGRLFPKLPSDISSILLECTREGLFIDLSKIIKTRGKLKIPIASVGHYTDMDKVYDFKEHIDEYKVIIEYSNVNKSWKVIRED
ncbi:hypothetical protein [Paenibacillus sp. IHBB 10380]|uniref:hypothetical protein n=1 Tax=Paenibacillus sp. IHBB 10380 TaxID=1566358 RepID=UPI000696885D|nr:hypothetical protein [Paenibacillus sp. IHBB 10380]